MTNGGDAAEQVVRLSLEGFEVAAKLSGAAAKNIAVLLVSVLKQEQKTKGKARLTNMIKSGKELKVFSIPNKDLKKFTEQAKRYGVLYCVLRDKNTKGDNVPIDIIARAEDASKIQRIVERFELGKVDKAAIVTESQKAVEKREALEKDKPTKSKNEIITEEAVRKPIQKEGYSQSNPTVAKTDKNPPSRRSLDRKSTRSEKGKAKQPDKPSVREELERIKSLGLKGVKLHPDYQGFSVDDEKMFPIYKKISQLGLITVFHAGFDYGFPPPYGATPEKMIKALKQFDSPVIAAHWGGIDCYQEVLDILCKENIYFDTSFGYSMMPKYYAEKILEKHGTDKILFGTDSPWHNAEVENRLLSTLNLSKEDMEKITHKNAEKLLGI